jgi:hypothetical protein
VGYTGDELRFERIEPFNFFEGLGQGRRFFLHLQLKTIITFLERLSHGVKRYYQLTDLVLSVELNTVGQIPLRNTLRAIDQLKHRLNDRSCCKKTD